MSRHGNLTRLSLLTGLLSAIIATPVSAQTSGEHPEFRARAFWMFDMEGNFTADAVPADVDGDGDLDILTANGRHWAQPDFVYFNLGNGRMLDAKPIGLGRSASYTIQPGDFDLDGDIDVAVVRDNLPAQIYANDGTGNFTLSGELQGSGGHARGAVLLDIEGDGYLDLIITRRAGADLLFRGQGELNFSAAEELTGSDGASTNAAAADLDNDGDMDVVVARRDSQPSLVLVNNGKGQLIAQVLAGSTGDHRKVTLGDFNGDGIVDIVLGKVDGGLALFLAGPKLAFDAPRPFGRTDSVTKSLAAGDLDQDGDIDLVQGADGVSSVHFNDGAGNFTEVMLDVEPTDTYGVAIADMNGDGLPDIVMANSGSENYVIRQSR